MRGTLVFMAVLRIFTFYLGKLLAGKEVASEETGENEDADDGIEGDDICSSHCFLLWLLSFCLPFGAVSCANRKWVGFVEETICVDNVTIFYEAGFLLGDELILSGELVAEGLNEIVFGGEFALQGHDGFVFGGECGIEDARHVGDVGGWFCGGRAGRFCFLYDIIVRVGTAVDVFKDFFVGYILQNHVFAFAEKEVHIEVLFIFEVFYEGSGKSGHVVGTNTLGASFEG